VVRRNAYLAEHPEFADQEFAEFHVFLGAVCG
jgi:hypothetical protein